MTTIDRISSFFTLPHQMEMVTKMGSTRRKTALIFLLIVLLLASQEKANMVAAESVDSCVDNDEGSQELKCLGKCFQSGKCNGCCKDLGYLRGKCSSLACYCCTKPPEKPTT